MNILLYNTITAIVTLCGVPLCVCSNTTLICECYFPRSLSDMQFRPYVTNEGVKALRRHVCSYARWKYDVGGNTDLFASLNLVLEVLSPLV